MIYTYCTILYIMCNHDIYILWHIHTVRYVWWQCAWLRWAWYTQISKYMRAFHAESSEQITSCTTFVFRFAALYYTLMKKSKQSFCTINSLLYKWVIPALRVSIYMHTYIHMYLYKQIMLDFIYVHMKIYTDGCTGTSE